MSQHDFNIANQGFPSFRSDLNNALLALASTNSGATEPSTTYANQQWYDTATNIFKIRNEANSAWIDLFEVTASGVSFNSSVGFGTNAPTTYGGDLVVVGDILGGETTLVLANSSSSQFLRMGINGDVAQIAYDNADALAFGVANTSTDAGLTTEYGRFTSGGLFLVGTTDTDPPVNDVNGAGFFATAGGVSLKVSGNGGSEINRTTSNGTALGFRRAGVSVGSISVTTTATAYNTSSDYRLKENVQPMPSVLDTLAKLNPVTYNWKIDGSPGQGFIAHELQSVVPECVTGEKDAVDEDGNPQYQGIDTSFLVASLVKAIQEQQEQIDTLKTEVAALKAAL